MRRPDVSPNGLGSAIQMVRFFVNRAGVKIPTRQKQNCLKAIKMFQIELAYLKQAEVCELHKEPQPVYPLPAPNMRVGGRYAKK
jgi:NCAIR mutase (PurE)-related protein